MHIFFSPICTEHPMMPRQTGKSLKLTCFLLPWGDCLLTFLIAPVKLIFPWDIIGLLVHTVSHGVWQPVSPSTVPVTLGCPLTNWCVCSLPWRIPAGRYLFVVCLYSFSLDFFLDLLSSSVLLSFWEKQVMCVGTHSRPLSFSLPSDAPPRALSLFGSLSSSLSCQALVILPSLQKWKWFFNTSSHAKLQTLFINKNIQLHVRNFHILCCRGSCNSLSFDHCCPFYVLECWQEGHVGVSVGSCRPTSGWRKLHGKRDGGMIERETWLFSHFKEPLQGIFFFLTCSFNTFFMI